MSDFSTGLKCKLCGKLYPKQPTNFCTDDFGPLEVAYDYAAIKQHVSRAKIIAQPRGMWRYREFLPIAAASVVGKYVREATMLCLNRALGFDPKGDRIISNVVLMGMGEPLANFENTVTALHLMLDDNAYGLSRRRVTVSTSGLVPAMDRLRDECPVALAVSLHAPNDALRDELVPINQKYRLAELMAACRRYLEKAPRDFVTFEYVMLDGVNDSDAHARQLLALTRDVPCKFNLIPFNPFPGSPYLRSKPDRIRRFAGILMDAGIVTTTRKTRGDDIDAACGQLAGQVLDKTRRSERRVIEIREARA